MAAAYGARDEEGSGLDAVREHGVLSAMEPLHPVDGDDGGAGALDFRAEGDEEVREIHDLRLARGVLDDGSAVRQGSGHHEVLGAGYGDALHVD